MTYREKIIEMIDEASNAEKAYLTAKLEFYCDIKNEMLRDRLEALGLITDSIGHKLGKLLAIAHDGVSGHLEYKEY